MTHDELEAALWKLFRTMGVPQHIQKTIVLETLHFAHQYAIYTAGITAERRRRLAEASTPRRIK